MSMFKNPIFCMWCLGVVCVTISMGYWFHPVAGLAVFGVLVWMDASISGLMAGIRALRKK